MFGWGLTVIMDYSLLHIGTSTYFFNLRTSPSSYHVSAEARSSKFICLVSIMPNSQGERDTQAVTERVMTTFRKLVTSCIGIWFQNKIICRNFFQLQFDLAKQLYVTLLETWLHMPTHMQQTIIQLLQWTTKKHHLVVASLCMSSQHQQSHSLPRQWHPFCCIYTVTALIRVSQIGPDTAVTPLNAGH